MPDWPDWWDWDLEFTPHLLKRMADRGFNEIELRQMIDNTSALSRAMDPGRWVAQTRHAGRPWNVILEPMESERATLVITAYPCG